MWLLIAAMLASAEVLPVIKAEYHTPSQIASCALLRARENERKKVIREWIHLNSKALKGDLKALLLTNSLAINKLFLPDEVWRDLNAQVQFEVPIPPALKAEIERLGLGQIYFSLKGPGLHWQSFVYQRPREMTVDLSANGESLSIRYQTYLSVVCWTPEPTIQFEWIEAARTPSRSNTHNILNSVN